MKNLILILAIFFSVQLFGQAGGIEVDRTTTPITWTISGDLDIDGTLSVPENHGFFGFQDSAFVVPCTQNNWSQVTNTGNDLWQIGDEDGITISNDTLTVPITGHYTFSIGLGFNGSANDQWRNSIFVNGSPVGFRQPRKTANNDTGWFGNCGSFDLTAGDEITIEVLNTINDNDYTAVSGCVTVSFIHR